MHGPRWPRDRPLRGQPLSPFSAAVTKHAGSAPRAHPAQEAVNAPAVTFLGLIGPFDRASVAEGNGSTNDTGPITSSHDQRALRYPQASAIVPARKHLAQASSQTSSTDRTTEFH